MNELRKLPQIIHQCRTIGEIPTSYKVSLTYEEQLMWFCRFLQEEVIPVVNNNSQVVQELQNYFDNLDVQEEINNKLDEMAESGELEEIISAYLETKALFCYNSVEEMTEASNLINGSYAKTLGYYEKNDGGNGLYLIRTITNEDVIDNGKIIAMSNENLVAELILTNEYINVKQYGAKGDGITDDTTAIKNAIENFKNIYFPDGIYLITDDIDVTLSPTIIKGNGRRSIIKIRSEITGFEFAHAQHNLIKDISFDIEEGSAIKCMPENHEANFKIENINIEATNSNKILVNIKNINGLDIYKSIIKCPEFSNSETTAIKLDNVINCRIQDNNILNHNIGILITDGVNTTSEGIEILDNLIYRNNTQILTENSSTLFYLNITNNIFDFCNQKGIEIKNSQSLKVSKNFFGINNNDCVPIKIYTTFPAGISDESINDNSIVYYTNTPTNAIINIGDTTNNNSVNGVKIKDNNAIIYKTFINIVNGSGIISGNNCSNGISGNKFIDGTYNRFIIKENINGGNVQFINARDTVNLVGGSEVLELANNTYYTYSQQKTTILYLTVANSETSAEPLYLYLKDPANTEISIGVKSLKGNAQYDTFSIIIPAQYSFKVSWDAAKNVSIVRQRLVVL